MKTFLVMSFCLIANAVCAMDFTVSQKGAFLLVEQKSGVTLTQASAIRVAHISSVTLDTVGATYRITIIVSLPPGFGEAPLNRYELKDDNRRTMEDAYNRILDVLARADSEKTASASTAPRR
jgi:hypothetical protein